MTSAPASVAVPVPRGWSTPQKLQLCLVLCVVGAVVLFAGTEGEVSVAQGVVKTIGQDTAPSILAAEAMGAELAGLDARAAAELLATGGQAAVERADFEQRRKGVAQRLVAAAESTAAGDPDGVAIEALVDQLGAYLELIGEARILRQTGDPAGALKVYFEASGLLHHRLLTAAQQLASSRRAVLDHAYAIEWSAEARRTWFEALVLAVLISLGGTQIYLALQSRRLINPPLLGATLVALAFLEMMSGSLELQAGLIQVANEEAFAAIHALLQARTEIYDASGDDSRLLLDEHGNQSETNPDAVRALLDRGLKYLPSPAGAERESIEQGFERYLLIEHELRSEQRVGKHAKAVELGLGLEDGQAGSELDHLDLHLGTVITADEGALEQHLRQARAELDGYRYYAPIAALAMAVLSWLGLRARLREYDF